MRRVERERRWENLWLPVTVDWSFRANRFELAGGQDLALLPDWRNLIAYSDWLLLTDRCVVNTVYDKDDRCVVTGCLLIDSRDTYASMIMRFARFSLTASFSLLSRLFVAKENLWDQGTKALKIKIKAFKLSLIPLSCNCLPLNLSRNSCLGAHAKSC